MSEALRLLSSVIQPKGDPPGAHPKSEFINTKTAAQWLGIPERSMQQYVQMGLLPSYKLGKHRLFQTVSSRQNYKKPRPGFQKVRPGK